MQLASNDKTVGKLKFPVSRASPRERECGVSPNLSQMRKKRGEKRQGREKDKEEAPASMLYIKCN